MINQCSSCGGFCRKSGCERENVKPELQRTWVGLTDEEITSVANNSHPLNGVRSFARAIEAKLKQKNHVAQETNS
jgi:hypothetical protein